MKERNIGSMQSVEHSGKSRVQQKIERAKIGSNSDVVEEEKPRPIITMPPPPTPGRQSVFEDEYYQLSKEHTQDEGAEEGTYARARIHIPKP